MTAQAARSYWMYNNGNQIASLRCQAKIINDTNYIFFEYDGYEETTARFEQF